MFDGGTIDVGGGEQASWAAEAWQDLHRRLKANHQQRSRLDARELDLLLEAEEAALHRRLGHPSLVEYMMAELDCTRHTANGTLRVAHELVDLPLIDREFHDGALSWTKVRELTRVATCETEEAWLDAIEGMGAHQVQRRVRGYRKGSLPSDPPDPSLATEWVGLEVSARMAARWRQMRTELDDEADRHLTDEELCERLCRRATTAVSGEDTVTRPAFQLAFKTCPDCE